MGLVSRFSVLLIVAGLAAGCTSAAPDTRHADDCCLATGGAGSAASGTAGVPDQDQAHQQSGSGGTTSPMWLSLDAGWPQSSDASDPDAGGVAGSGTGGTSGTAGIDASGVSGSGAGSGGAGAGGASGTEAGSGSAGTAGSGTAGTSSTPEQCADVAPVDPTRSLVGGQIFDCNGNAPCEGGVSTPSYYCGDDSAALGMSALKQYVAWGYPSNLPSFHIGKDLCARVRVGGKCAIVKNYNPYTGNANTYVPVGASNIEGWIVVTTSEVNTGCSLACP